MAIKVAVAVAVALVQQLAIHCVYKYIGTQIVCAFESFLSLVYLGRWCGRGASHRDTYDESRSLSDNTVEMDASSWFDIGLTARCRLALKVNVWARVDKTIEAFKTKIHTHKSGDVSHDV